MTKQEYLDYGKQYLELKSITEQWKFGISIEKKFPKAKFLIFNKWMNFVNYSESHIKRQQSKSYYLERLESMLTSKK